MNIDTTLINAYIKNDVKTAIKKLLEWQRQAIQYYSGADYSDERYYAESVANLVFSLNFIKQNHITLRGLWDSRASQITSYNTKLTYTGDLSDDWTVINEKLSPSINTLISNCIDVVALGQVLFFIDKQQIETDTTLTGNIELIRVPPQYYMRKRDGGFMILTNTWWHKKYGDDADNYIYLQDNYDFAGGVQLAISKYVIAKDSNMNNWYEGNNRLLSTIIASYDAKALMDASNLLIPPKKGSVETLEESMKKLVEKTSEGIAEVVKQGEGQIVIPDAVKIEKQDLIDYNIAGSFSELIDKIDTICEVAILGQAGTTRQSAIGSNAKAMTMQLTTDNIKWSDINVAKKLVRLYIEKALPFLTTSITQDEISFDFIFDDTKDVLVWSNILRNLSDSSFRTDSGKKLLVPVAEVFRGLGLEMNREVYDDSENFVVGNYDNERLTSATNNMFWKGG